MKKQLFFLAAAALALASCSNDETTAVKQSPNEVISFRPLMNGVTRAAEKTAFAAADEINVWAVQGASTSYFDNVTYTYAAAGYSGFSSDPAYYWPATIDASTNKLTFYATHNVAQTSAGSFSLTPETDADNQVDVLTSMLEVTSKPSAGETALTFKHALSEIIVQAKNSNTNLKVEVTKVKVGYVAHTGTCTFTTGSPVWSNTNPTGPAVAADVYSQNLSTTLELTTSAQTLTGTAPWMILPQNLALSQLSPAIEYTKAYKTTTKGTATSEANLNCAYIALELKFYNSKNDAVIIDTQWCYWPITTNWEAGNKYTYIIDAAQGGYQPTNVDETESTDLDKVLEGLEIKFNTSTSIDAWVTVEDINSSL